MNSWKSIELSAWTPPLITFIIGTGQDVGVGAADVLVERHVELDRGGLGDREARAEDRVGTEAGLVVGAVEVDHDPVDQPLVEGVVADQLVGDLVVDEADGGQHALAAEAFAAVAEFDRLVFAGRRSGGNRGAALRPRIEEDVDLDRRVAPAVENLASVDADDLTHTRGTYPIRRRKNPTTVERS